MDRARESRSLPPAVAVGHRVGREHADEAIQVAAGDRVEEPARELVLARARGLEPWLALADVPARSHGDLTAVLLGLADDLRDLVEAVLEHLAQQEDRALDRGEALEEHQEAHREGVGGLGVANDIVLLLGQERLGEPGADVALPSHASRTQVVDAQSRGHRRQVGLGGVHLGSRARLLVEAQERLLDDVLGVGRAAEHPVRDREDQRPELFVYLVHAGPPVRAVPLVDETASLSVTPRAVSLPRLLPRLEVVAGQARDGRSAMARNEGMEPGTGDRGWVGPELPSLSAIVVGTLLFATGGMLIFTVIGTPLGILLFAVGLGMLLTPKERRR